MLSLWFGGGVLYLWANWRLKMILFLCGIAFLVAGYFLYGRVIERLLGPDERPTPAVSQRDGVDYLPLPMWKNTLIQLRKK